MRRSKPNMPPQIWGIICNHLHYDPEVVVSIRLRRDSVHVVYLSIEGDLKMSVHDYNES